MRLSHIPPEIIFAILRNCASVADVLSFTQSCRRFHSMLSSSQSSSILFHAAETEFGPLCDIIQLLTLNNSQPAHYIRDPPRSKSLLQQIIIVGRVARRWEDIYPVYKWDADFADRRSLSLNERYRLRRAIYRHWLYCHAFHTPNYPRTSRRVPPLVFQRAKLLHNWSTEELIEIKDFHTTVRAFIGATIYPSDSTLDAMWIVDRGQSHNDSGRQPLALAARPLFHTLRDGRAVGEEYSYAENGSGGWRDPVTHYYVVEDMLKLDPKALLWLHDHPWKQQVESYLESLGEWFHNNGDTFAETLAHVLHRRKPDLAAKFEHTCSGIIEDRYRPNVM